MITSVPAPKSSIATQDHLLCLQLAQGRSTTVVARNLGLSEHTVIAHERWIYDKFDVHNRVELVSHLLTNMEADATPDTGGPQRSRDRVRTRGSLSGRH